MKKKAIDSVRVRDACTESWEKMIGNDQVRFCSHCSKDVNNISAMTRKEARKLVRRSGGSLCIRYVEHPETKAPLFDKQMTQITRRRVPLMAAGVMSASLSLAGLTYAQGGAVLGRVAAKPDRTAAVECEDKPENKKPPADSNTVLKTSVVQPNGSAPTKIGYGSVKGIILDSNGAMVPGFRVSLLNGDARIIRTTMSNDAGEFNFHDVPFGVYTIKTDASAGFAPVTVTEVVVSESERSVVVEVHPAPPVHTVTVGFIMVLPKASNSPLAAISDVEEIREMIAQGSDLNEKDDDGNTPIFAAVEEGNIEAVQLLLDHGAKVNIRNQNRQTPLMMIDAQTPVEVVEMLLLHGAKVNRSATNGDTALIRAAGEARLEVLRALIRAGADLDAQNEEGVTALMNAADSENLENVRILLEAGANVNLRDTEGDNAWDYTTEQEVEDLLVSYGVVLDPEDLDRSDEDESEPPANAQPNDNN